MKSKILVVFLLCLLVVSGFVACGATIGKDYVTPESFGAKGDGKNDDSYAISKCILTGKKIRFSSGKNYLLKNPLQNPKSEQLYIDGNGAKLTISEQFKVSENGAIFYYGMPRKKILEVKNLDIVCLLGQKFPDKETRGDTYIFAVESCDEVRFDNVKFKSEKYYNNVTFLRDNGSKRLEMNDCNIVLNTLSVQGGVLWFMNRRDSICSISLKNSYFEYDTKDECVCFSVYKDYKKERCNINVEVENCEFFSKGESVSSGFILVYSNSKVAYSDINVKYKKCMFKTVGDHLRRIQAYQICPGDTDYDYGRFHTIYDYCKFDFKFVSLKESGLIGALYSKGTSMSTESISYVFNHCDFDVKNVSPLVDGKPIRRGKYEFIDCRIKSDASLFLRRNIYNSDIQVYLTNCDLISNDIELSKELFVAKDCRFKNKVKTPVSFQNPKSKMENCKINGVLYK
jgi:hypothetical protein